MLKIIDEIQKNLLNVIFPNCCNGCSKLLLKNEHVICAKCIHNLPFTNHHLLKDTEIHNVFYGLLPFEFGASIVYFHKKGITQNLIHNLKYRNREEIGTYFGNFYSNEIKNLETIKTLTVLFQFLYIKKDFMKEAITKLALFVMQLEKI